MIEEIDALLNKCFEWLGKAIDLVFGFKESEADEASPVPIPIEVERDEERHEEDPMAFPK